MLRNDIKIRVTSDLRGKITTGRKNEKGLPEKLEYFNVSKFPELIAAYGNKPDKLIVFFPANEIESFYSTEYNTYGSNQQKKRKCNGETCVHHIPETLNGIEYGAGTESPCVCKNLPDGNKERCKCYMFLKAFIADMNGIVISPICYFFQSNSSNTADNLYSEIEKIWQMTGGKIVGVPFLLSVKIVSGQDTKQKFPIWSLQSIGTIQQLNEFSRKGLIPSTENMRVQIDFTGESPNLLSEGPEKELATDGDYSTLKDIANQKKDNADFTAEQKAQVKDILSTRNSEKETVIIWIDQLKAM